MRLEGADGESLPVNPAAKPAGSASPARPKQTLDQTRIIPQGVNPEELQGTGGPPQLGSSTGFEKKSNRGNKIFLILVIIVGCVLVGALLWVLFKSQ